MITSSPGIYERNLPVIARAISKEEFRGRLPGIHIEGPFISLVPGAVGAHNPEWVRSGNPAFLERLQELAMGRIRLLTVAAEIDNAGEVIRHATDMGICVSLGHQMADERDLDAAAAAGAKALTHLGNGIPSMLLRHPNPLWSGLAEDRLAAMIITDGHHLPPSVIKIILKVKGVDRTIVVSDASPMTGMPPGEYQTLGNPVFLEETGLLHNPEKGVLVGSSATMLHCMNYLRNLGLFDLKDLLDVGFYNPLKLVGCATESINPEPLIAFHPDRGFAPINQQINQRAM